MENILILHHYPLNLKLTLVWSCITFIPRCWERKSSKFTGRASVDCFELTLFLKHRIWGIKGETEWKVKMDFLCNKALMSCSTSVCSQARTGRIITLLAGGTRNLSVSLASFLCALLDNCNEMQMRWKACQVHLNENACFIHIFSIYIHSEVQIIESHCYDTTIHATADANSYTNIMLHYLSPWQWTLS